jgi:hypothetical protein
MMLICCICTPIFINTFVVFIRLYWFEKRFQNVVLEARTMRATRTRTLSRRKSEMVADNAPDVGQEERAVGDRNIQVMRSNNGQTGGVKVGDEFTFGNGHLRAAAPNSRVSDDVDPFERPTTPIHQINSNIVWADTVNPQTRRLQEPAVVESPSDRLPERDNEKSIAFVESQRNPKDRGMLRIPGPRDFDRGLVPEPVAEGDLTREVTRASDDNHPTRQRSISVPPEEMNGTAHPMKYHVTIDVPDRQRATNGASVYNRTRTADLEVPNASMQLRNRSRSRTFASFLTRNKEDEEEEDPMPYLSWAPTIGRNSNFVDLTEEQREELGGIEYRALKLLAIILVCYFVGFHLLGMVCLTPWVVRDAHYANLVRDVGVNPVWWGIFTPASMFNDLGFTLTPDSMVSFQFAVLPLLLGTFLIIIGNTGFPCMLRFVIWLCSVVVPRGSGVWEELRFLLDHPRRCFTLLFPSKANWWLFWVLILLNGVDLIFFIVLDVSLCLMMYRTWLIMCSSTTPPSSPFHQPSDSSMVSSRPQQPAPRVSRL